MDSQETFSITAFSACLAPVLEQYPVELAYLYGSMAANRQTPFSDVDIALLLVEDAVSTLRRLELELTIEDEIVRQCNLSRTEVRIINDAPLTLRGQVVLKASSCLREMKKGALTLKPEQECSILTSCQQSRQFARRTLKICYSTVYPDD
jgi:predicted nucleotidyltransferase